MANQANINLDSAVRKYVQQYIAIKQRSGKPVLNNRNTRFINQNFARAMRIYVGKRLEASIAASASAFGAGATVPQATRIGAVTGSALATNPFIRPPALAAQIQTAVPTAPSPAVAAAATSAIQQKTGQGNSQISQLVNTYSITIPGIGSRKYDVKTGKFINANIPPYYSVKKGLFGATVNVNNTQFRNWAKNKTVKTLLNLPQHVKTKVTNFSKIIANKVPRTNTSAVNTAGAKLLQARGLAPPLPLKPVQRILMSARNKNTAVKASINLSKFNAKIIQNLQPSNQWQASAKNAALKLKTPYVRPPRAPLEELVRNPSFVGTTRGQALLQEANRTQFGKIS
jgi:hypothetical protein